MTFSKAIETIRSRAGDDIEYIVNEYVKLKRSGSGMKGLCPFHEESTASFSVSAERRMYYCFGCEMKGDVIDFVMRMEGMDFNEAIYKLADRYFMNIDSNSKDTHRETFRTNELILPGISDLKNDIRKSGKVFIAMNDIGTNKEVNGPKLNVQGRISDKQAEVLRKIVDTCVLLVNNLPWEIIKESIETLLKTGFSVEIANPSFIHIKTEDWLTFTLPEYGGVVTRKDIIELLAAIPNDLDRSCFESDFSTYLNNVK